MKYFISLLAIVPTTIFAATLDTSKGFSGFVNLVVGLIQNIIYFVFALVIIVFLWGVVKYWIVGGGDADSVEEGRDFVLAGIIGLVVMFSLWGIVRVFKSTFFGG